MIERRQQIAEENLVEDGRKILKQVLSSGKSLVPPEHPEIDLAALLNKTMQDSKAVVIRVSGVANAVESGPLEI